MMGLVHAIPCLAKAQLTHGCHSLLKVRTFLDFELIPSV
jgi:hypothetical protein